MIGRLRSRGFQNSLNWSRAMNRHPKLVRVIVAVFGLALALPVAMTITSRIANASGYIVPTGDVCDQTPENVCR
jgi:hypothetical protein